MDKNEDVLKNNEILLYELEHLEKVFENSLHVNSSVLNGHLSKYFMSKTSFLLLKDLACNVVDDPIGESINECFIIEKNVTYFLRNENKSELERFFIRLTRRAI